MKTYNNIYITLHQPTGVTSSYCWTMRTAQCGHRCKIDVLQNDLALARGSAIIAGSGNKQVVGIVVDHENDQYEITSVDVSDGRLIELVSNGVTLRDNSIMGIQEGVDYMYIIAHHPTVSGAYRSIIANTDVRVMIPNDAVCQHTDNGRDLDHTWEEYRLVRTFHDDMKRLAHALTYTNNASCQTSIEEAFAHKVVRRWVHSIYTDTPIVVYKPLFGESYIMDVDSNMSRALDSLWHWNNTPLSVAVEELAKTTKDLSTADL